MTDETAVAKRRLPGGHPAKSQHFRRNFLNSNNREFSENSRSRRNRREEILTETERAR
jgi:hypothetical protein